MKKSALNFFNFFSKTIKYALILFIALFFLLLLSLVNTYQNFKSAAADALSGRDDITSSIDAIKNKNWPEALNKSQSAENKFQRALVNIASTRNNKTIAKIGLLKNQVDDLEYLVKTAEILSRSLSRGVSLISEIDKVRSGAGSNNFVDLSTTEKNHFLKLIYESGPELNGLKANLTLAQLNIEKIHKIGVLWPIYQKIADIKTELNQAANILDQVIPLTKVLPILGGYPEQNHFLIILQNNDELRPSGGFIGVYGLLTSQNGEILSLKTYDSYHLDMPAVGKWNYPAPAPISKYLKVNNWYFRDSNWSPDWPQAAEKMIEIYNGEKIAIGQEKENFSGVIGITPDLISNLLRITGPITVNGETYNENNLQTLLQYNVEVAYKEQDISAWDRKNIINDLISELKTRLFSLPANRLNEVLNSLQKDIAAKNIQLYFTNPDKETLTQSLRASGEVVKYNGNLDYLMVVDANLAAFKSDAVMQKDITYNFKYDKNTGLTSNLVLNYKHNGDFNWRTTRYRSYTRVYAPFGSEFISLNGLDEKTADLSILNDEKLNKTVFGFFLEIEPGSNKEISLKYRLPGAIKKEIETNNSYNLIWQNQAGSRAKTKIIVNYKNKVKQINPGTDQNIRVDFN
ncbi:MAG: DUF4012 domain-containing protein [Patescibacteria group bacterium]